MRLLMLLALVLCVAPGHAAQMREEFVLSDGRTFIGSYDVETQTLTFEGGKAGIKVRPDQIESRRMLPAAKPGESPSGIREAATMTPEEKAANLERVRTAQKEEAIRRTVAEAEKADREAADYDKQAATKRDQAHRDAQQFQLRAQQEGTWHEIETIKTQLITTYRTRVTNSAILGLMADATKIDQRAKAQRELAARKRALVEPPAAAAAAPEPGGAPAGAMGPGGAPASAAALVAELQVLDQQISELQVRRAAIQAQLANGR